MLNQDRNTVKSFGDEWSRMNQSNLSEIERKKIFNDYFLIFPFNLIGKDSIGFDMGCGSGRWAAIMAPLVKRLFCIDASSEAIKVARENLKSFDNINYQISSVNETGLDSDLFDFGYSLGVLHHLPNTSAAITSCAMLLKKGSPFLLYLYYSFDNKPLWYKLVWQISELVRGVVNKLPPALKMKLTDLLAIIIYLPLSRIAFLFEKAGFNVDNFPLSYYKDKSFYTMRTDSRDRFGTPLEKRFSKIEIKQMMEKAGFKNVKFSEFKPYWVVVGSKG
ncbi:class I SAM-dependent methyltransferase [bacterium]|nr:class I SAM-dependent methyltransferase [bacterium]